MSVERNPTYVGVELLPSASRNVDGAGAGVESFAGFTTLRTHVAIDSVTGGGLLRVRLEDSIDGTHWGQVAVICERTSITAPVVEVATVTAPFGEHLRVRWETAVTATFEVHVAARS